VEEVIATMEAIDLRSRLRDSVLELRGDGKAGGGLVLAFQTLAHLFLGEPGSHVQEWPFFSSARRGANIRSFLRVSAKPIQIGCEVTRPSLVLLMDEAAARSVDFTQGVPRGGTFVLNTRRSPEACAKHFHLSGRVFTVAGDDIGQKHLGHAIGNVSAYVAMAEAVGGLDRDRVVSAFLGMLAKRRIPDAVIERNRAALQESFTAVRSGTFDLARDSAAVAPFAGYGELPVGAQTPLRLSRCNRTADYAPSGIRLRFEDPVTRCTGCAHCVTNCPEGIIRWRPDPERGLLVIGADVNQFCKLCGECIRICPEGLFRDVPFEEAWPEETEVTS
jgi:pyruvate ferredoxin oxidoreductase gamma subunit